MKKFKNPLLHKTYNEGVDFGIKHGIQTAVQDFAQMLEGLEHVPGIGEKTIEKIRDHLNNGKTEKRDPNQTAELVTVIKRKKGRATVVMINGDRYILDMGMRK